MSKNLFLICATLLSISCSQKQIMTEQERNYILSGDENTPFRVLTVDDAADSLILRTECSDLDFKADSALIARLIARMDTTMKAENGVGLAAPQIGILRNIFLKFGLGSVIFDFFKPHHTSANLEFINNQNFPENIILAHTSTNKKLNESKIF